jgi:hypothetical protein
VDSTAVSKMLSEADSDHTIVTARFDARAPVVPDDLVEVSVTVDRLHFFDLATGRAIR